MKRWLIVTIVILILIGGVATGYYFWHKNNNNNSTASSSSSAQNDYLVIKEWGVKFKLPSSIASDVYYHYDGQSQTITFGSKKYSAIAPLCGADKIGLRDRLVRYSVGQSDPAEGLADSLINEVEGYKYYVRTGSASCDPDNKLNNTQAADLFNEKTILDKSFEGLVKN